MLIKPPLSAGKCTAALYSTTSDVDRKLHDMRLLSIQMPVYLSSLMNTGKQIYTLTMSVSVCVHIQESSSLVDSYNKPYLLSKRRYCRVEKNCI